MLTYVSFMSFGDRNLIAFVCIIDDDIFSFVAGRFAPCRPDVAELDRSFVDQVDGRTLWASQKTFEPAGVYEFYVVFCSESPFQIELFDVVGFNELSKTMWGRLYSKRNVRKYNRRNLLHKQMHGIYLLI